MGWFIIAGIFGFLLFRLWHLPAQGRERRLVIWLTAIIGAFLAANALRLWNAHSFALNWLPDAFGGGVFARFLLGVAVGFGAAYATEERPSEDGPGTQGVVTPPPDGPPDAPPAARTTPTSILATAARTPLLLIGLYARALGPGRAASRRLAVAPDQRQDRCRRGSTCKHFEWAKVDRAGLSLELRISADPGDHERLYGFN